MRLGRSILSFALLGVALAVPAVAQSQGAALSTYPECKAKPTREDSEAAHTAFLFGRRKIDEADYSTAINYFKDAYKTDCTKHELLPIIARAYELAGNKAEAINALEVYLKRVPEASDAETQRTRIANLKAQLSPTTPSAGASASVAPTSTPPPPPPPPTSTSTVAPPPPDQPPAHPQRHTIIPWIVTGAGVVAAGAGLAFVIIGNGNVNTANSEFKTKGCDVNAHTCPAVVNAADVTRLNSDLQSGYTQRTIGWIGVGVGVAAIAGGLTWHFLEKPAPKESSLRLAPQIAPGYAGIGAAGAF